MELKHMNGALPHLPPSMPKIEPELVSPETLSQMWEWNIERIYEAIAKTRRGTLPDPFPFKKIPGSRLIRIPLKKAREWLDRGNTLD